MKRRITTRGKATMVPLRKAAESGFASSATLLDAFAPVRADDAYPAVREEWSAARAEAI